MNTSWAHKTAERLRGAQDAEKRNTERLLKEHGMVIAQASSLWNSLYATIEANVSELTQIEPYLKFSPSRVAGLSEFTVTSHKGRDHIVVRLDFLEIQYQLYRRDRTTIDEPNIEDTLTFKVNGEQVWLTTSEGVNMTTGQGAEYLLEILCPID